MLKLTVPAAVLSCAIAAPALRADTVVSSFPQWDGSSSVTPSGSAHQALGQTFTVPDGVTTLDAIRTAIDLGSNGGNGIRIYIFATAGNQATGAPLFRSAPIADPGSPAGTFTPLAYAGINAAVTPGQTYLFLFSNAEGAGFAMHGSYFASTFNAPAASPLLGSLVGWAPGAGAAGLTGVTWSNVVDPRDLIVELTFIPAPATAPALALGAFAFARPRRRG
jgi:hypothetical protein